MSESNLKLSNQLCFPLYVCSKEIISKYKEFLDKIDLTYTQYIVMLALWEQGSTNVRQLGNIICLDSGTLTPLLKKLEKKGLITRTKDPSDERNLIIDVTKDGYKLKDKVKAKNLNWKVENDYKARGTAKEVGSSLNELR